MGLCDVCKKMQLRITSSGIIRPCILNSKEDKDIFDGDIYENLNKTLANKKSKYV